MMTAGASCAGEKIGRKRMATIKTEGIDGVGIGHKVVVRLYVQTTAGRFTFPFTIDDQGSAGANERLAHQQLRTFLQEALQVLPHS
jgi:hypothetical protein